MRQVLSALAYRRAELCDAVLSAQGVYRGLVEKARERAEEIVAGARQHAEEIRAEAQRQQDEAVQRVEKLFSTMKAQHEAAIETINAEWQDYLCGLYPEPEEPEEEELPEDLEEKLGAIADQIQALEEEE